MCVIMLAYTSCEFIHLKAGIGLGVTVFFDQIPQNP